MPGPRRPRPTRPGRGRSSADRRMIEDKRTVTGREGVDEVINQATWTDLGRWRTIKIRRPDVEGSLRAIEEYEQSASRAAGKSYALPDSMGLLLGRLRPSDRYQVLIRTTDSGDVITMYIRRDTTDGALYSRYEYTVKPESNSYLSLNEVTNMDEATAATRYEADMAAGSEEIAKGTSYAVEPDVLATVKYSYGETANRLRQFDGRKSADKRVRAQAVEEAERQVHEAVENSGKSIAGTDGAMKELSEPVTGRTMQIEQGRVPEALESPMPLRQLEYRASNVKKPEFDSAKTYIDPVTPDAKKGDTAADMKRIQEIAEERVRHKAAMITTGAVGLSVLGLTCWLAWNLKNAQQKGTTQSTPDTGPIIDKLVKDGGGSADGRTMTAAEYEAARQRALGLATEDLIATIRRLAMQSQTDDMRDTTIVDLGRNLACYIGLFRLPRQQEDLFRSVLLQMAGGRQGLVVDADQRSNLYEQFSVRSEKDERNRGINITELLSDALAVFSMVDTI